MSSTEQPTSRQELEQYPSYSLGCVYDDCQNPSELTLFTRTAENRTTEWITAGLSTAIPLDEIR